MLYWVAFRETMGATVRNLFIKVGRGKPMLSVESAEAVSDKGLVGDRSFGRVSRQVLLIDFETLSEFELAPGDVRENLTTIGLDPDSLSEGTRLTVGDVRLTMNSPCAPCDQMEALRPGLRMAIDGRRGRLATVERGGTLRVGDSITIEA